MQIHGRVKGITTACLFLVAVCILYPTHLFAQEKPEGAATYVLTGGAPGDARFPFRVNFDSGVVSGTYTTSNPVTDSSDPDYRETIEHAYNITGSYQHPNIEIEVMNNTTRTIHGSCGDSVINQQERFTLYGTLQEDLTFLQSQASIAEFRIDPKTKNNAVPPKDKITFYIIKCGDTTGGFRFGEDDMKWKSEPVSGTWKARTCNENEELSGAGCKCKLADKSACSPTPSTGATTSDIKPILLRTDGDVEYQHTKDEEPQALTRDITIQVGDTISTGPDSWAKIQIGEHTITIPPLTQLRIDEYLNDANVHKTQLYLFSGAVRGIVKHTDSIRSDFSVTTPTANASIRGSELLVTYNQNTKITNVYAIEGTTYVKGVKDASEMTLDESTQTSIGQTEKANEAQPFTDADIKAFQEPTSFMPYLLGLAILVILAGASIFFFVIKGKTSDNKENGSDAKKESDNNTSQEV